MDSRRSRRLLGMGVVLLVGLLCWRASWFDTRALLQSAALADPTSLVVGIALSMAAVTNRGFQYRSAYRAVDLHVPAAAMIRTTTSGYAANKVVRVAGASGLAVFLLDGRRRGFAKAHVVTACAIASLGSFAALGTLLGASVLLMSLNGDFSAWWAGAVGLFVVQAVVGGWVLRSVITGGPGTRRIESLVSTIVDRWQRRKPRGDLRVVPPQPHLRPAARHLGEAWHRCRHNPAPAGRVMVHALLSKALGAAMLATAVRSFDLRLGIATVVVLYATALAASFVSILPGGIGAVEASMTAMLVSHGVPASTAALTVVLFRLFDLGFPVVVGLLVGAVDVGSRSATPEPTAADNVADSETPVEPEAVPIAA